MADDPIGHTGSTPLSEHQVERLLSKLESNPAWMFGVGLALLGSLFGGLGDNLVRRYHRRRANNVALGVTPASSGQDKLSWVGGMVCTIVLNTSCTIGSYSFAEANLVMPFGGGMHIIWGILFATWINGEKVTSYVVWCCATIIAGVVTVVISGSKDRPLYSSSELLSFYESKTFEAYVVLTVVVMLLLSTVFILPLARSCAQHAQVRGNNASGAAEAAERERAPLAGEAAKPRAQSAPSYRSTDVVAEEGAAAAAGRSVGSSGRSFVPLQVEQFCATVLCGLCGANTNLLAKIAVMYMTIFIGGNLKPLMEWDSAFWPTIIALSITGPAQLYLLNRALSIGSACVVSPIVNATLGSWGTVACVLYFREWFSFTPAMWILIPCGVGLTTIGTLMLVQSEEAISVAPVETKKRLPTVIP